jgi:hypothetical protein
MTDQPTTITTEEAEAIAVEAYVYLYPLVTMEMTRRQMTSGAPGARTGRGPMGAFTHVTAFPTAEFKDVVRPNFDTLYSAAWVDISAEPVIVSAPAAGDRYYLLPCLDMWTDVFASPGSRTSGNAPIDFALCSPGWSGSLPDGVERIDAPTPIAWIVGRTQTNGPDDYPAVQAFQRQLRIVPLSSWGSEPPTPPVIDDPTIDQETPPLDQVNAMSAADYFALGAQLMGVHPPHLTDWSTVARMRRLGIEPGEPLDLASLSADARTAVEQAPQRALATLATQFPHLAPAVNGWMSIHDTMGVYGNFYVKRAVVAMVGLGANQPEDAIYPVLLTDADGSPLDGANRYVIHMDADELPPVDAFWSVTMYDAAGFQVANEIDRYAIGDRDALRFNDDGSLDLYLQTDNPGPDRIDNWLPTTEGTLGVTMRLYRPRPEALMGDWNPPPVLRVS